MDQQSAQQPSQHPPPPAFPRQAPTLVLPQPQLLDRSPHPAPTTIYTQKHMKQLVEELRFKEKMQAINRKKGKYKRSTNNCHKKYIGILKNLLFSKLQNPLKEEILKDYNQYRNSRVYYFIILTFVKWCLSVPDVRWVFLNFCKEVQGKINRYRLESNTTSNINFIHFRRDEIIEMQYSIQSINYFLRTDWQEAIRILYQKNKNIIIKKSEHKRTVEIIQTLEAQMESRWGEIDEKVAQFKLEEVCQWKREMDFGFLNEGREMKEENSSEEEEEERVVKRGRGPAKKRPKSSQSSSEQQQEDLPQSPQQFQNIRQNLQKPMMQDYLRAVKREEPQQFDNEKYPLIDLQNSYPTFTEIRWHSWLIQNQKKYEFRMKCRQNNLKLNLLPQTQPAFDWLQRF